MLPSSASCWVTGIDVQVYVHTSFGESIRSEAISVEVSRVGPDEHFSSHKLTELIVTFPVFAKVNE